jgi:hypothetical protein
MGFGDFVKKLVGHGQRLVEKAPEFASLIQKGVGIGKGALDKYKELRGLYQTEVRPAVQRGRELIRDTIERDSSAEPARKRATM